MKSSHEYQDYPRHPTLIADHVLGPATAPIIVLEYGCYCCPRETETFAAVRALRRILTDQMAFVFRHFPLVATYPTAFLAAEAAEAAAAQGCFWRMHKYLVEHACAYSREDLIHIAGELRLDAPALARDLDAHVHAERVRGHFHSGIESNVRQMPAVFVNGLRCRDEITVEGLRRMVEEASARAA